MLSTIAHATGLAPLEALAGFRATRGLPQGWGLTGHCLRTSAALVEWLAGLGVESELVAGICLYDPDESSDAPDYGECSHAWVVCEGHVIDLTAGQFGTYPDILIVPVTDPAYRARQSGRICWIKGAIGWPPDQRLEVTAFVAQILRAGQVQDKVRELLEARGL
jgi:hypothetical protein